MVETPQNGHNKAVFFQKVASEKPAYPLFSMQAHFISLTNACPPGTIPSMKARNEPIPFYEVSCTGTKIFFFIVTRQHCHPEVV